MLFRSVDIEVVGGVDPRRVVRTHTVAGVKAKELQRKGQCQALGEAAAPRTVVGEARRSPKEEVLVFPRCLSECCSSRRVGRVCFSSKGWMALPSAWLDADSCCQASYANLSKQFFESAFRRSEDNSFLLVLWQCSNR